MAAANTQPTIPSEDTDVAYAQKGYWEKRYSAAENEPFEWFFTFNDISPILHKHLHNPNDFQRTVDLGCGDSSLLIDLYKDGVGGEFVGLDFSKAVVDLMNQRVQKGEEFVRNSKQTKPRQIRFEVADITQKIPFAAGSVDLCFDKSTMDCILHAENGEDLVRKMLEEVGRCLSGQGTYVMISQLNHEEESDSTFLFDVVFESLSRGDPAANWSCTAHCGNGFPLHVYVISKRKRYPTRQNMKTHTSREEQNVNVAFTSMFYD